MEGKLISSLVCPSTFDSVDALRTHLSREHGNGISGVTNEKGSHSGNASIKGDPALPVSPKHEASFEESKLVHDGISGLSDQIKTVLQQNECPPKSNDADLFPKQCFKEQTLHLSYVEDLGVKQEVRDHGNSAATGPEVGASSTQKIKYLDSFSSLNQGGDTNAAEDLQKLIQKTNGSSTDMRAVFKEEYQDEPLFVPDDVERMGKKQETKQTPVHLDIPIYKLPLCEECGISFERREHFKVHLDSHNRCIMTTAELSDVTCTDPKEMERGIMTIGGTESIHVSNGASASKTVNISDTVHDTVDLPYDIKSNSRTIPQCTEEITDTLETRTLIPNPKIEKGSKRRFGCSVCSKCFICKAHLKEHMITHTRVYPYKCDVCEMKFRRTTELEKHNILRHSLPQEKKVVKTKHAEKRKAAKNKSPLPETHSNSRTGPQFTEQMNDSTETGTVISDPNMEKRSKQRFGCSVCSIRFICKAHLKEHMIRHTRVYPYKCDLCKKGFIRISELKKHNILRHGLPQEKKVVKTKHAEKRKAAENKSPLPETHSSSRTGPQFTEQINDSTETGTLISDPNMEKRSKRRFGCTVCSKRFICKAHLKEHMITHTRVYPFKCDVCEMKFRRISELEKHNILRHGIPREKKVVETKYAEKRKAAENKSPLPETHSNSRTGPQFTEQINDTTETGTLNSDPNMENRSKRRFGCSVCSKRFICNAHLKEHMITHTRVYPYKCDLCKKEFIRITELKKHNFRRHGIPQGKKVVKTKHADKRKAARNKSPLPETHSNSRTGPQFTEQINESTETGTLNSDPNMENRSKRRFGCSVCSKRFICNAHLKEHMITHTRVYPYKCDLCKKGYIRTSELKKHNILRHGLPQEKKVETKHAEKRKAAENKSPLPETHSNSRTGPQFTEQMNDTTEPGTLNSDPNMENRSKRRFGCSVCSKRFICNAHLKEHIITHTRVYPYKCDLCKKGYIRTSELKHHKCRGQGVQKYGTFETPEMEIHLSETNTYSRTEQVSENNKILEVTNECKDLEKEGKKSLTEVDLPIKSDIGNTNLKKKSEFITCDICNKKVRNQKKLLRQHSYTHEKKHACEICMKVFVSPSALKTHMMVHTGERPVLCSQCGKGFVSQGMLNVHLTTHSNVKPFKCSTCGKSYKIKGYLKQHNIQCHTSERTNLCHICGKAFFHLNGLNVHMLTHEATRKYECLICGKAFLTSSKLGTHKLTHSVEKNIKCELCDYSSLDRSGLKAHMRKHSDHRPYKCDECEQTFKRKNNKDIHMRIHYGFKPYKCDACDAAFTHYAGLYLHKKRHVHETT